eukprot:2747565-Pyramimonas_sp.AAC.1
MGPVARSIFVTTVVATHRTFRRGCIAVVTIIRLHMSIHVVYPSVQTVHSIQLVVACQHVYPHAVMVA